MILLKNIVSVVGRFFSISLILVFLLFVASVYAGVYRTDVVLQHRIEGVVSDLFGAPISDAVIRIQDRDKLESEIKKSDSKGRFLFDNVNSGDYTLTITALGFRRRVLDLAVTDGNPSFLLVGLLTGTTVGLPDYRIHGVIYDTQGRPLTDALIRIFSPINSEASWEFRTDERGGYSLSVPAAGDFVIIVMKSGYSVTCTKITLAPPQLTAKSSEMNFRLRPSIPFGPVNHNRR